MRPVDQKSGEYSLPAIPHVTDLPRSGTFHTPDDVLPQSAHAETGRNDYFSGVPKIPISTSKSLPSTPHGTVRNITFSQRIQFFDAWSSAEYDRRGEIATCNRLTPMLAQQIKEELNSFKMVSAGVLCLSTDY